MPDIIFAVVLAICFFIPALWAKQYRLALVFLAFFICFGFMEWLSIVQTDLSISQHMWELSETSPIKAWAIIAGMGIAWICLLAHFAKNLLKRR